VQELLLPPEVIEVAPELRSRLTRGGVHYTHCGASRAPSRRHGGELHAR
jgi:hypothetical protein